jgi:hypothetical protein
MSFCEYHYNILEILIQILILTDDLKNFQLRDKNSSNLPKKFSRIFSSLSALILRNFTEPAISSGL